MNPSLKIGQSASFLALVIALAFALSSCGISELLPGSGGIQRGTATPMIRPTFTPRPTNTAWPTFTPVPTLAPVTLVAPTLPGVITGVISSTVNLRAGPGTNYPVQTRLSKGTKVKFRGRDLESAWLMLVPPPNGWIKADYVALASDIESLPVVEAPPTPIPTATIAPSPTAMPTATPPMYVDFRVDAPYLPAGGCTTARWDVEGVRGVYFEGQGQPGHGSADICPKETHTFVLHVVLNSGYLDRAITVTVLLVPTPKP
ncbi:MAG: SH3 domain-containing protein [Chloroflexi bacterium]|nr:SH3 domain-containing protein [Chloroflexota bacterium]MCL5952114.1 SH3 domain-containing protein [Chloroflexota bacterium]